MPCCCLNAVTDAPRNMEAQQLMGLLDVCFGVAAANSRTLIHIYECGCSRRACISRAWLINIVLCRQGMTHLMGPAATGCSVWADLMTNMSRRTVAVYSSEVSRVIFNLGLESATYVMFINPVVYPNLRQ